MQQNDPFYGINYKFKKLRAIQDRVIVEELDVGIRFTKSGILIPSDQGKLEGIRPRWGKVYAIGKNQKSVTVGQWVLVEHARWTRGLTVIDDYGKHLIRMVEFESIMAVSDKKPPPCDM